MVKLFPNLNIVDAFGVDSYELHTVMPFAQHLRALVHQRADAIEGKVPQFCVEMLNLAQQQRAELIEKKQAPIMERRHLESKFLSLGRDKLRWAVQFLVKTGEIICFEEQGAPLNS